MKSKRVITVVVFSALALVLGYWIGYQRGNSARLARNSVLSSLRQVGLGFRSGHNDIGRFQVAGDVNVAKTNVPGK